MAIQEATNQVIAGDYVFSIYNGVLCRRLSSQPVQIKHEKVPEEDYPNLPQSVRELLLPLAH